MANLDDYVKSLGEEELGIEVTNKLVSQVRKMMVDRYVKLLDQSKL